MGTAVLVPVEEYLRTSYEPDYDYVDGELLERHVGEQAHGDLITILGAIFRERRFDWNVRPVGDSRVQVKPRRFRLPDVCVLRKTDPKDPIIRFPPLLCIEILSKDDRLSELQSKVDDFAGMGVQAIWVIDPRTRKGYHASCNGFEQPEDGTLRVPGTPIAVSLADLFRELDES
jgi:Uma2 family endonuclease